MTDCELILHHYDFSPFSEKVRLIFGLKSLRWHSVIIPPVMPKPHLTTITGGYRHTPVMQIGADIFCDTRMIARELERRYPSASLFEQNQMGLALAVEAWAERDLFWPIARYVSGISPDSVIPDLHADRAALRGKHFPSNERLIAVAKASVGLIEAQLFRIENMLRGDESYILSNAPGLADLAIYHGLWFLSAMPVDCSSILEPYPAIKLWMKRIQAIGHGEFQEMPSWRAIEIATQASPAELPKSRPSPFDPTIGSWVKIRPDEYADSEVTGELLYLDRDEVAIRRSDPVVGDIVVHFPRVGYSLKESPDDKSTRG